MRLEDGMTVRQLRAALFEVEDQDAPVLFVCDYGDYSHTQQALFCDEVVEGNATEIRESAYSQSGFAYTPGDDGQEWYCESCDDMFDAGMCPKCGEPCVNEQGEKFDETGEALPVVVIKTA